MAVLIGIRAQPAWRFIEERSSLAEPNINTATLTGTNQVTDFHLVNLAVGNGEPAGAPPAGAASVAEPHVHPTMVATGRS